MSSLFEKRSILNTKLLVRLLLFMLVILTAFTGPWWVSCSLSVALILFAGFYEVVLGGIILDVMFADKGFSLPIGDFVFTSLLLFLISFSWLLSKRLRGIGTI